MYRTISHNFLFTIFSEVSVSNLSGSHFFQKFYKIYLVPESNKLIIIFVRLLAKYSTFFIFTTDRFGIRAYGEVFGTFHLFQTSFNETK